MSEYDLGEGTRSPFFPKIETDEDGRKYIENGGVGWVESRIEDSFAERLEYMRGKIVRLEALRGADPFLETVLIESILVDCRALFLEGEEQVRRKNATLQNVYRARQMDDKAKEIDEVFERTISGASLKDIIKGWVDKRIAHMDFLKGPQEDSLFERMREFVLLKGDNGLLPVLRKIVEEYEAFVNVHGANTREQIELVMRWMTSDPEGDVVEPA